MNQPQNPLTASPKQRFMQNASNVATHRAIVQSPDFQRSLDSALLNYTQKMSKVSGQQAAISSLKIAGAVEFIEELKTLAEATRLPETKPQDNLSQNK